MSVAPILEQLGFFAQAGVGRDQQPTLWRPSVALVVVRGSDDSQAAAHELRRRDTVCLGALEGSHVFWIESERLHYLAGHVQ